MNSFTYTNTIKQQQGSEAGIQMAKYVQRNRYFPIYICLYYFAQDMWNIAAKFDA